MPELSSERVLIILGVLTLFGIITFALAAATLGTLNKRFNHVEDKIADLAAIVSATATTTGSGGGTTSTVPSSTTTSPNLNSGLAERIKIEDLMDHLRKFEQFAKEEGNTRAIATPGFTKTLDYIVNYLSTNTNLSVFREKFSVKNFSISGTPVFQYSIDGAAMQSLTYSTDLPKAEFTYVNYAASISNETLQLVRVMNNGCNDSDWGNVAGKAVLVIVGGVCTTGDKAETARNKSAAAVIFYSNGLTTSNLAPSIVRLRQTTNLPALFLSYAAGSKLADALNESKAVNIAIDIQVNPYSSFDVENICADTKVGNRSETIVIGSHSDSVPAGPGINDNGQ